MSDVSSAQLASAQLPTSVSIMSTKYAAATGCTSTGFAPNLASFLRSPVRVLMTQRCLVFMPFMLASGFFARSERQLLAGSTSLEPELPK